jgi:hypothetical protein
MQKDDIKPLLTILFLCIDWKTIWFVANFSVIDYLPVFWFKKKLFTLHIICLYFFSLASHQKKNNKLNTFVSYEKHEKTLNL